MNFEQNLVNWSEQTSYALYQIWVLHNSLSEIKAFGRKILTNDHIQTNYDLVRWIKYKI